MRIPKKMLIESGFQDIWKNELFWYENLSHAFVPSVYGNIMKAKQEYSVEQHISEDVIADIANWINTGIL